MGVLLVGVAGFAALLLAASSDLKLGLIAVGGFAGAVLVFALGVGGRQAAAPQSEREHRAALAGAGHAADFCATRLMRWCRSARWRWACWRWCLLVLLRTDLIGSWRKATPPDAPNRFVINVSPSRAMRFKRR
jgi:putative ABC transport system permease protein